MLIDVTQSHPPRETYLATHRKVVIHRIPITHARINLGQVARRVHINKEYFILEKDGIPVAAIMNVEELEDYLELKDPALKEHIRKSYQEYRRGKARGAGNFLKELRANSTKPRI
jgi:Antitoxin Phd_YefM, type II toxin-antitoxin system